MTATATNKYTQLEWHLLPMPARAAILRHKSGRDFLEFSASVFSFASENFKEGIPAYARNRFRQMMVPDHPANVQILDGEPIKLLDQFRRFFVMEMFARSPHLEMAQRNFLPLLATIGAALLLLRQLGAVLLQIVARRFQMALSTSGVAGTSRVIVACPRQPSRDRVR